MKHERAWDGIKRREHLDDDDDFDEFQFSNEMKCIHGPGRFGFRPVSGLFYPNSYGLDS